MKTKYAKSIVNGRIRRLQKEAEEAALREAQAKTAAPAKKKAAAKKAPAKKAVKKVKTETES